MFMYMIVEVQYNQRTMPNVDLRNKHFKMTMIAENKTAIFCAYTYTVYTLPSYIVFFFSILVESMQEGQGRTYISEEAVIFLINGSLTSMYCMGSFINHVDSFLDIFDRPSPFVDHFTK